MIAMFGQHLSKLDDGQALKQLPCKKMQLATKCAIAGYKLNIFTRAHTRDVEYIDLYYLHQHIDQSVP